MFGIGIYELFVLLILLGIIVSAIFLFRIVRKK